MELTRAYALRKADESKYLFWPIGAMKEKGISKVWSGRRKYNDGNFWERMRNMKSKIAELLQCERKPVAVIRSEVQPEEAMMFKEGSKGCIIALLNAAS